MIRVAAIAALTVAALTGCGGPASQVSPYDRVRADLASLVRTRDAGCPTGQVGPDCVEHALDLVESVHTLRTDLDAVPGDQELWTPVYRAADIVDRQAESAGDATSQGTIIATAGQIVTYVQQNPLR